MRMYFGKFDLDTIIQGVCKMGYLTDALKDMESLYIDSKLIKAIEDYRLSVVKDTIKELLPLYEAWLEEGGNKNESTPINQVVAIGDCTDREDFLYLFEVDFPYDFIKVDFLKELWEEFPNLIDFDEESECFWFE